MDNPVADNATTMQVSAMAQASQGFIVQNYCQTVLSQANVDFSGTPGLGQYQTEINNALGTAQGHATNYDTNIQPAIIQNLANITNYYTLNNTVPTVCPDGSTVDQWVEALTTLETTAEQYQTDATTLATTLNALSTQLDTDSGNFSAIVTALNSAVGGDNGALVSYQQSIDSAQTEIDGAIAGVVGGAVGLVTGIVLICVGALAEIPTAGVSTGIVVAGGVLLAGSVGGEVAADVILAKAVQEKASLITDETNLKAEVNAASSIGNTYNSLQTQVQGAATAAEQMSVAWQELGATLTTMIADLNSGILDTGTARTMFLDAANNQVANVMTAVQTINAQMAGVTSNPPPPNQTLPQYLNSLSSQSA